MKSHSLIMPSYHPPAKGWSLLRAFLDPTVKPTITERCEVAGIRKDTFYRWTANAQFSAWFRGMLQEGIISEMSDVRMAHFRMCLKENLDAIKLWYERYGDFVPTQKHIIDQKQLSLSVLADADLDEITGILERTRQLGEGTPGDAEELKQIH